MMFQRACTSLCGEDNTTHLADACHPRDPACGEDTRLISGKIRDSLVDSEACDPRDPKGPIIRLTTIRDNQPDISCKARTPYSSYLRIYSQWKTPRTLQEMGPGL